jgi:Ca2+-binding EF-hand superfamily protein
MVDDIWDRYDADQNGFLDYNETLNFTKDFMDQLGESGKKGISVDNFEKVFKLIDKDGSGQIDKEEMAMFVA